MIKGLGIVLIIAASTILGFYYGEKFKKRLKELKELQRGVYILKSEINFTHSLLPEALYRVYEKCDGNVGKIFLRVSELLNTNEEKDVYSCFNQSIGEKRGELALTESDVGIFLDFTKTLGEMDIDGHNDMLALTLENLGKAVEDAERNIDKNVKMYRYLGFSFGAMVGIILI